MIHRHPILTFFLACFVIAFCISRFTEAFAGPFIQNRVLLPVRMLVKHRPDDAFRIGPRVFFETLVRFNLIRPILAQSFTILVCFSIGLLYLKSQNLIARQVLRDLHEGRLESRLPASKLAQFGGLVGEFNRMADEIETLVEKLRASEQRRAESVREMAHDVRTPLTSLQLVLGSIRSKMPGNDQKIFEKLETAAGELAYLQNLIEGLLILAQIEDPTFHRVEAPVDLSALIRNEIARLEDIPGKTHLEFIFEEDASESNFVYGDEHLLTRGLRNALENACRFARSTVRISLRSEEKSCELTIRDDGPGFSREGLSQFGVKSKARLVDPALSSRISVGLGSAILRRVIENYGGSVVAGNWGGTPPSGGQVVIRLRMETKIKLAAAANG